MGTEIINFGPRIAEKTRFEVAYSTLKNHYQNLLLSKECPTKRLGLGLKGQSTFIFGYFSSVRGVLELSCHQLHDVHWNFVNITKNDLGLKRSTELYLTGQ